MLALIVFLSRTDSNSFDNLLGLLLAALTIAAILILVTVGQRLFGSDEQKKRHRELKHEQRQLQEARVKDDERISQKEAQFAKTQQQKRLEQDRLILQRQYYEKAEKAEVQPDYTQKIQLIADSVHQNRFKEMPRIRFIVADFEDNRSCRGIYWKRGKPVIIPVSLLKKSNEQEIVEYLNHEYIHCWLICEGKDPKHNEEFNNKTRELNLFEVWDE